MNPHQVTKDFEKAICDYTGARYAVAVNSCTAALFLALKWNVDKYSPGLCTSVFIPKKTYCSVPMQIIHAGCKPEFEDKEWAGAYPLRPFRVWDCAKRFTSAMYVKGQFQCVSFHWRKILGLSQGGAILHDDPEADVWFRRARFDGRTEGVAPKDDKFILGYHCYLSPEVAAHGLMRMSFIDKHNPDQPVDDYPDLSQQEIFK